MSIYVFVYLCLSMSMSIYVYVYPGDVSAGSPLLVRASGA